MSLSLNEEEIKKIAYLIWIDEGSPDGNQLVLHGGKMIPLKERHWQVACLEWTYGKDYLRSW